MRQCPLSDFSNKTYMKLEIINKNSFKKFINSCKRKQQLFLDKWIKYKIKKIKISPDF